MAALKRGIAHYADGTDDVRYPASAYPASGLKADLSNAVMRNGFLTAPGDPRASQAVTESLMKQYGVQPQVTPEYAMTAPGKTYIADQQGKGFTPVITPQPGQQGTPTGGYTNLGPVAAPAPPAPSVLQRVLQTLNPISSAAAAEAGPAPAPAAPAAPAVAPSGIGQLMSGQFAAARDNPASSPATAALGQFADYINRNIRAQNVAAPPSLKDWTVNLFTGDQASTKALQDRAAASQTLSDPLVRSNFMINPHALARAEQDPVGFAQAAQNPDFRAEMARAVGAHTEAATNPKITADEHPQTVAAALNANVPVSTAHVAVAPNKYTEDEFVKTFSGIPTKTFALLFANQLGHVATPQEKVAREVFDRLHGDYSTAANKVKQMEAEDAAAQQKGLAPPHSGYTLFGKNPYDTARAERDAKLKALMDAGMAFTGISARPYPIPGQQ